MRTHIWPPALTITFAAVVAMWVAWFLTHMPATTDLIAPSVKLLGLSALLFAAIATGTRLVPRGSRLLVGLWAGVLSSVVNMLILGSKITTPLQDASPATGGDVFKPNAFVIVAAFLATGAVIGTFAGAISMLAAERPHMSPRQWLSRFAIVATVAVLPLLCLGGLVTSAKAGFAVVDWPGTFGRNMFLYPIALMSDPRIFLEHTHRLFGAMVGLTTVVMCVFAFVSSTKWIKIYAAGLVVLVCLQGYLGGVWVQDKAIWQVLTHGTLGQLFFGLMAGFAVVCSPAFDRLRHGKLSDYLANLNFPTLASGLLVGSLTLQLIMGALIRHSSHADGKGMVHAIWAHAIFSLVVVILSVVVGAKLMRASKDAKLTSDDPALGKSMYYCAHGVTMVVGLQFLLGWVALWKVLTSQSRGIRPPTAEEVLAGQVPELSAMELLIRTAHQANGALLMALAGACAAWCIGIVLTRLAQTEQQARLQAAGSQRPNIA